MLFADELEPRRGETATRDVVTTGTPSDCEQDSLVRVLDINLMTCMYTCMAVAPYLKRQRSGKIVIIRAGRLGDRSHLAEQIPLRREGTIEDCAKVVELLVTDLSDYVTGKTITIDGGWCDQP